MIGNAEGLTRHACWRTAGWYRHRSSQPDTVAGTIEDHDRRSSRRPGGRRRRHGASESRRNALPTKPESLTVTSTSKQFRSRVEDRMKLAAENAIVMHPGPMNRGVEIDSELAGRRSPQSVIHGTGNKRRGRAHGGPGNRSARHRRNAMSVAVSDCSFRAMQRKPRHDIRRGCDRVLDRRSPSREISSSSEM